MVELLLSSTGRIGRVPFTIAAAVLLALGEGFARLQPGLWHGVLGWPVYCALLFSGACLMSKRLHDRGRRGWWAFLPVFALIGAWPWPETAGQRAWALVLILFAVDLCLLPGKAGYNRFGPRA